MTFSALSGTLVVSNSSQLLFTADDKHYISLLDIAKHHAPNHQEMFLLQYFGAPLVFEQGATLANFFLAIAPWEHILSMYTHRDVGAYIKACRQPAAALLSDFSCIKIHTYMYMRRHTERANMPSHVDGTLEERFAAHVKTPRHPTSLLAYEHRTQASGVKSEDPNAYALSGSFQSLKNLPLVMEPISELMAAEAEGLLASTAHGASVKEGCVRFAVHHDDGHFSLQSVVDAILVYGLFFHSPESFDAEHEDLRAMCQKYQENKEQKSKKKKNVSLSVAVAAEPDKPQTMDAPVKEKSTPSISVRAGAFDGVADAWTQEHNEWMRVVHASNNVRIGVLHTNEYKDFVSDVENSEKK